MEEREKGGELPTATTVVAAPAQSSPRGQVPKRRRVDNEHSVSQFSEEQITEAREIASQLIPVLSDKETQGLAVGTMIVAIFQSSYPKIPFYCSPFLDSASLDL